MSIYNFLKKIPINTYKVRACVDKNYRWWANFLSMDQMSSTQIKHWQLTQLIEIVDYAFDHVPAYKELYSKAGYKKGEIGSFEDFKCLPFVTKSMIKEDFERYVSDERERIPFILSQTGGTTGQPMRFFLPKTNGGKELAFYDHYWKQYGYRFGEKTVILRGNHGNSTHSGDILIRDVQHNNYCLNSDLVSDKTLINEFVRCISESKAQFLRAYPSAAVALAHNCENSGIPVPRFKVVILGSESSTVEQMEYIKEVYQADVVLSNYGHSEQIIFAALDPTVNKYCFFPQYGYVELDDILGENNSELVGTSYSKIMPFIRYRTNDFAVRSNDTGTGIFKHNLYVEEIQGRKQDFIVTKDKRLLPIVNIDGAHFQSFSNIMAIKYQQVEIGKVNVYVEINCQDDDMTINAIRKDFLERYNKLFDVRVIKVDKIDRTKRGKRVLIDQQLDIGRFRKNE